MLESPVRVALLARPGEARDQLRRALAELGAQLVAEGDPAELDPGAVAGEKPSVVLVSLEPAVEDALSRFDDLLAAPGIEVMYDDAEVTRQLDGWDLARWARHLAAKLVGGDLLPPAPGGADHLPEYDLSPQPGAPRTPAQEMAHEKLEDYAAESLDLSEWVPSTPSLADAPVEAPAQSVAESIVEEEADLELDLGDLEQAMGRADAQVETTPRGVPGLDDDLDFDPQSMDIDLSALPEEGARLAVADDTDTLDLVDEEPLLADVELADGPVSFSSFSDDDIAATGGMDDDVAALAAQLDAYEANGQFQAPREPDFATLGNDFSEPAAAPAATPAAPAAKASSFGSLELIPMDAEIEAPAASAAPASAPARPASSLGSGLSLAAAESEHAAAATAPGALLVFAGLGGPDAVRQLLSALPPTLPVPVLLYQHLDTGKHDRLVGQLAKASRLPVDLAVEGKLAFAGRVAVLPPGVGLAYSDGSFRFTAAPDLASLVSALPAGDSMVLLLSGAAASVVPAVLALKASGARVLAQTPATCFDASAAESAIAAGAEVAEPSELARLIVERWT
jgi:chemosensory pili system protein ChpB (putative protein-glutamate methylesterase)